ncbi:MAG: hypothetical protein OEW97_06935, partial [Gammaproteobacteria bacterium]|nr:hypothetical protein [Gammaproteobacteria bacterium]
MNYLKFNPAMFQSKVARRVTLLFLISALVPLITTAYLSKTYINEILTDQSYTSLQNEGRYFGRTLFDRLLFLELRLKSIASQVKQNSLSLAEIKKYSGNEFITLRMEKSGTNNQAENNNPLKRTHLSYSTGKNDKTKIFMATNFVMPKQNINYKLIAEINADYIWETTQDLLPAYNLCIISESGLTLLCTAPVPDNIAIDNTPRTHENKKLWRWTDNNEHYISTSKIIFLKSRFESENWKTIITQAEKNTLLPTEDFNR